MRYVRLHQGHFPVVAQRYIRPKSDAKITTIMRLADQRDILVRLHRLSLFSKTLLAIIYTSIDDVIFIRTITARLLCPVQTLNRFSGGVVLTIPQLFVSQSLRSIWSRDIRSRPIRTLHFTMVELR